MGSGHLICPCCRIRVLASASAIDLLEARCPICESELSSAAGASSAIGFRLFDLDPLAEAESDQPRDPCASPVYLPSWREAASAPAAPSARPSPGAS